MEYDLTYEVRKEDLTLRTMFVEAIVETSFLEGVKKDAGVFHDTLSLAHDRNWIHPTRLAENLRENGHSVSDSNTRKWFKIKPSERSTPNNLMMIEAFKAVSRLMQQDIESLQSKLTSRVIQNNIKVATAEIIQPDKQQAVEKALAI